jgi:uncharacterized protein YpmS
VIKFSSYKIEIVERELLEMKNYKNLIVILVVITVLAAAALACNMPSNLGKATETNPLQPDLLATAPTSPETVTVTLTEGQINTVVQQVLQGQTTQTIESMQVHLAQGQVVLDGTINQNGLSLPVRITLFVNPDQQGGLTYDIDSATVGGLPLPATLRNQIQAMLNQQLRAQVRQLTNNIYIESVTIGDGIMTVTGRPQ